MPKSQNIKNEMSNVDEEDNKGLSTEKKYSYLEDLRNYIFQDVVLADTKAGFALTIVAFSLAACAALFKDLPQAQASPWINYINFCWITGLVCAGLSVLCAMLTILPRSYISHEMVKNPSHWVHLHAGWRKGLYRRFLDTIYVVSENVWQKQTKGTSQSLKLLINSNTDSAIINSLHDAMQRALLVQNFKFLWVGKAILFAFIAFLLLAISLFLTLGVSAGHEQIMPASVQHRLDEKVKVYNTSVNRIEARDSSANIYNEERVVSEKENEKEMKTTKPRVQ